MNLAVAVPGAGGEGSTVSVSEVAFGKEFNEALVHQVVVAYMAGARQGTVAQKNRSQVKGGGRKPWRQKGTGRARAGTIRSPLWRGGGNAFPARPQDYSKKVNRKMYQGAVRSILSELVRQGLLVVVQDFEVSAPKTKLMVEKLAQLELKASVLLVLSEVEPEQERNIYLAARNLEKVEVLDVRYINPVSLISYEKVVITVAALKKLEEILV